MHRQPHETRRQPTPLLVIGNGQYAEVWFAAPGGKVYQSPGHAPLPTDPNREPWSWRRFSLGVVMGMLMGLLIYIGVYFAVAMVDMAINALCSAVGLR